MRTTPQSRIDELTSSNSWAQQCLHQLLAANASKLPDLLALKDAPNRNELCGDSPTSLTWQELNTASDNLARQLHAAGIKPDDIVVIQLPNIVEIVVLFFACSKMGVIASPVPVQYGPFELEKISQTLDAKTIITVGEFRGTPLGQELRRAFKDLNVLVFGEQLSIDTAVSGTYQHQLSTDANAILSICWTSGTTGTPKGVPRSHNMWTASSSKAATASGLAEGDRVLCPFPMVNMAALGGVLFPATLRCCSIFLHHPLEPELMLMQMQDEQITYTLAPPAVLNQLAKSPQMWNKFDFKSLRAIGSGSAPLSPWMIEVFSNQYGVEVINIYGSNEGIGLFSTPAIAPEPEVRASMFPIPKPADAMQTKVVDTSTHQVLTEVGAVGELLVHGPSVFDGYFEHPTSEAKIQDLSDPLFDEDGYFHTGDLVEICGSEDGFYKIAGRCKDIINRGGMKISPIEIDVALEGHPDIAEAAVCAYPDDRLGEKICACLVLKPQSTPITLDAIVDFLQELGMAKFKLPQRLEYFDALPRNAIGKVQRFALQEQISAVKK